MSELGRAGMHVFHEKKGNAGRVNIKRLVEEAGRHLDERLMVKQADRNVNVDPSRSAGNELWVNDGQGGMVLGSVDDVLDRFEERTSKVRRKVKDDQYTLTEIVVHLPKSMCVEDTWTDAEGKTRTFYRARDEEEAKRYFETAHGQVVKALPGGADAILSKAMNVDEYTPHMQYLCDTFAPDDGGKTKRAKPGDLRVAYSDAWGSSRRSTGEGKGKKTGQTVQLSGARKMEERQAEFRKVMVDAGFPVHLDADPVRSKRGSAKADYIEVQENWEKIHEVRAVLIQQAEVLEADSAELDEREMKLDERETKVKEKEERAQKLADAVTKQYQAAEKDGRAAGKLAGHAEGYQDGKRAAEVEMAEQQAATVSALARAREMAADVEKREAEVKEREKYAEMVENNANDLYRRAGETFDEADALFREAQDATGADEAVDMMMTGAQQAGATQAVLQHLQRVREAAKKQARTKKQSIADALAQVHTPTQSVTSPTKDNRPTHQ